MLTEIRKRSEAMLFSGRINLRGVALDSPHRDFLAHAKEDMRFLIGRIDALEFALDAVSSTLTHICEVGAGDLCEVKDTIDYIKYVKEGGE